MRAISILLDDARDVLAGKQTLHPKCWSTPYRGPLLLCGAKPFMERHPAEAICIVDLVDCRRRQPGDGAAAGRSEDSMQSYSHVWQWAKPRAVVIVPIRGSWGVYDVDDGLIVLADGRPVPATPIVPALSPPQLPPLTGLVDVGRTTRTTRKPPVEEPGQAMLF